VSGAPHASSSSSTSTSYVCCSGGNGIYLLRIYGGNVLYESFFNATGSFHGLQKLFLTSTAFVYNSLLLLLTGQLTSYNFGEDAVTIIINFVLKITFINFYIDDVWTNRDNT